MSLSPAQSKIFLVTLTLLSAWFLYVISDYLFPIFWAMVFTIMLVPVSEYLEKKTKLRKRGSVIIVLFSFFLFLCIPIVYLADSVIKEGVAIQSTYFSEDSESVLMENLGLLVSELETNLEIPQGDLSIKFFEGIESAREFFGSKVIDFGQNILGFVFALFLTMYITYFFMIHQKELKEKIVRLLPLGDTKERELIGRFSSMTRATIKGTVIIIGAQAVVAFIFFYFLGVDGALLWSVILGVASLIPVVGSALVWVPVALGFILAGSAAKGIAVLLFGVIILSNLDNVLRPVLVGKSTGVPDVIILISTLGGLSTFGLTGLVLGPVLASLVLVMFDMYEKEYAAELDLDD